MKRNILILFAVVSLLISITGCGGSGHSNSVAPLPTTMTSVKVNLTQNGQAATGAEAALYTPAAAMREGLAQTQSIGSARTSLGLNNSEGIYKPTSTSGDGTYTFSVPTGEYTLIASKGNAKAVIPNIRAAVAEGQVNTTVEVASLTPTATIEGAIAVDEKFGIESTGVIVYLEKTSCVAMADADGNFKISGVPIGGPYHLAAMSNQNGRLFFATAINVSVNEDLSVSPSSPQLTLVENREATDKYQIKGKVTDSIDIGVKDVLVMATNTSESLLYVATTNEQGEFTINTNTTGYFTITVIGASPESVEANVDSNPFTIPTTFKMSGSSAYGSVKGKINNDTNSTPDVGRYLVQLIGVDGTPYRTQTKSDYDQNIKESIFTFDNVYPGTYTILVDPSGNGFVGSVGTFTVKASQITDLTSTDVAEVKFVQPIFTASATEYNINIIKKYPFIQNNLTGYYKKIGIDDLPIKGFISGDDEENPILLFIEEAGGNPLTVNGKYEITLQNSWSDDNTGLSGTLTGTQILNYNSSSNLFLGNIPIDFHYQLSISNVTNIKYESVKIPGACISAYDDNKNLYYCSGGSFVFNGQDNNFVDNEYTSLFDVSGIFALVAEYDTDYMYQDLYCYKIGGNGLSSSSPFQTDIYNLISASIVADKYIAICYADENNNKQLKLYTHSYDQNNQTSTITEKTFSHSSLVSGYDPICAKLAQNVTDNDLPANYDQNNSCYMAVLYRNSNGDHKIIVYDLSNNNEVVAQSQLSNLTNSSAYLMEFNCLRNNSFYIGTNDSNYSAFILSSSRILDESRLANRKSCFLDENGFMYRYDKATKSIIKTTTLDGKPLDLISEITIDGNVKEIRGILGLNYIEGEPGNDGPTYKLSIIAY